jgi:hypothetical protein
MKLVDTLAPTRQLSPKLTLGVYSALKTAVPASRGQAPARNATRRGTARISGRFSRRNPNPDGARTRGALFILMAVYSAADRNLSRRVYFGVWNRSAEFQIKILGQG